jgi:fatty-acyl-CoA synthase
VNELLFDRMFDAAVARYPSRLAVQVGAEQLTFGEVWDRAARVASALQRQGVGAGDRVVWTGPTCIEAVSVYVATARIGAIFTPLNPGLTRDETRPYLDCVDASVSISLDESWTDLTLPELLTQSPGVDVRPVQMDESDPHAIYFTSGTTGKPKGVVLSHRADMLRAMVNGWVTPAGPVICTLAQFHKGGWGSAIEAWLSGDPVLYADGSDPLAILRAVESTRASRIYCIPAVWRRILSADPARFDVSSIRHTDSGTSPTSPALLAAIAEAFPGAETRITYGATETGNSCHLPAADVQRKPHSVGVPAPGVRLALADDGELLVRTPYLASGYYRDEAATASAFVDGWYRSGEIAARDEEGYWSIVGRVKDLIRTGGESVAPSEVDAVIAQHPSVLDAAVAGVPDETWGEVVTAFVVLKPGATLTLSELRDHSFRQLASHKQPRRLVLVDAIPRTSATGQVQRTVLVASLR